MTRAEFDEFIDNSTHKVAIEWELNGGTRLTTDQLWELNDLLTAHFATLRPKGDLNEVAD